MPVTVSTPTKIRWYICGLLFIATIFNNIDRQVFSILAPDLQRDIGWSELTYGRIVIAFQFSYAVSLLLSGGIIDRIGTKLGFGIAMAFWSVAEMAHALCRTAFQFGIARVALGLGEAANWPGAMKAIAEWFPATETSVATGILNIAPTLGAVAAPLTVPVIAAYYGWRGAFVMTGVFEAVWLIAWWKLYDRPEKHPRVSPAELALIQAGRSTRKRGGVPIGTLLRCRQMWALSCGKIFADPAWFFYLFWLPKFLAQEHGVRGTQIIPYLTVAYILCGIGSTLGGFLSSSLLQRGWSVNGARKATMALSAVMMPIVIVAAGSKSAWTAAVLIGVTLAAHQSWSTMTFTISTDLFPSWAVASAMGAAAAAGSVSTIVFAELAGRALQRDSGGYLPLFVACGLMYSFGLLMIHLLAPRLEPAKLASETL